MGLIHAFVNWGIRLVDNTDADVRRIKQQWGSMPLSWRQVVMANPTKDGLAWRVPDPDVRMASSFMSTQALLVSENEQVILLRNGKFEVGTERGVLLSPGLYDITRVKVRDQLEAIWMTSKEIRLRWGIPDVLTQDRIGIGTSGYYTTKIADPEAFYLNVFANTQVYKEEQLQSFTKSDVNAVVRDLIARRTVMEFQSARREILDAAREVLQPTFQRWGLEFIGLTVENQNIPEQFRQMAAARTLVTMEKEGQLAGAQADVTLAQLEAQKAYFTAQVEATKLRSIGQVNVELMQSQQNIGVNPLEIKRIEAIEALALNPPEGTLVDNRAQLAQQLLGSPPFIAPMTTVTGSFATGNALQGTPALPPGNYNSGPLSADMLPRVPSPTSGTLTREKILEMHDKLHERLILGEITDQKHSELSAWLQKKLDELT